MGQLLVEKPIVRWLQVNTREVLQFILSNTQLGLNHRIFLLLWPASYIPFLLYCFSQSIIGAALAHRPCCIPDSSNLLNLPITKESALPVVQAEVSYGEVIDLHTHLLPPTHGSLCLWGIDELLTYVS